MLRTRLLGLAAIAFGFFALVGGTCSRDRVESVTRMNEGVTYASQKRFMEAAEKLESAAAIDPTNDQAYWNLAIVHMEMSKFERARDDLRSAIDANDQVPGYHQKLGEVLYELGDDEGAIAAFQRALELDQNLFRAHYRVARVHERLDQPQEALQAYTRAIEAGPRFVDAYAALGRMYADLGYTDLAVQVLEGGLEVVIEGTEDEARLHNLLASVYQQMGEEHYADAVEHFRAAIDLLPSLHDALFGLGWTYYLQNDQAEARRYLQRYIDAAAGEAQEHYLRAARDRLDELGQP
ncbi:MAG: tetratricopeptide repeat protein [Sandaracinaceae bacterium]